MKFTYLLFLTFCFYECCWASAGLVMSLVGSFLTMFVVSFSFLQIFSVFVRHLLLQLIYVLVSRPIFYHVLAFWPSLGVQWLGTRYKHVFCFHLLAQIIQLPVFPLMVYTIIQLTYFVCPSLSIKFLFRLNKKSRRLQEEKVRSLDHNKKQAGRSKKRK